MQDQNYQLQHKLADYFRRKNVIDGHPDDRSNTDQEQRYLKFMGQKQNKYIYIYIVMPEIYIGQTYVKIVF